MTNAQDLSNPLGKIHRVNDDGTIPKDNPFVGTPNALPSIWSYGHRNPQGLSWDPVTGLLWESEHGPTGGDEINIIEKGKNYGWGVISMGQQNGITKRTEPGMEDAHRLLHADDRAERDRLLRRREVPGLEEQPVRRRARRAATAPARDHRPPGHRIRRRSSNSSAACARSPPAPMAGCTCCCRIPTGAGTGLGLAASTPGMVIRLVPEK